MSMMWHAYNPSTGEAEAGLWVGGETGLHSKTLSDAGCLWLMPVTLATQRAEISSTEVRNQLSEDPTLNKTNHKKGLVE
jgi:hypothetical protein